jgi:flagellar motor switch protein FliG
MARPAVKAPAPLELTGPQRAALLVMYLEKPVARSLLEHLSSNEIEDIGRAMATVGWVEPEQIEVIVREFLQELYHATVVPPDGPDFAMRVLPDLVDEGRRRRVAGVLRREMSTAFQTAMAACPARTVAALLAEEHPQARAVALLLVGADVAARVLGEFSEADRIDVSSRMAQLDDVPAEMVDDVEASLLQSLDDAEGDRWKAKGTDRTAQILGRMDRSLHDPVLGHIANVDAKLSETLKRRMVTFNDLSRLDDRSVQALLKEVDRALLMVALRGSTSAMTEMFLRNLSSRAAADLREEIELMAPLPKAQIEQAREEVVRTALRMSQEGTLRLHVGSADDLV